MAEVDLDTPAFGREHRSDLGEVIRKAKDRNKPTLEGLTPGVERVYRFNFPKGEGPIVTGSAASTGKRPMVRVEHVKVAVGDEGWFSVKVTGQKLLQDGRDDTRTSGTRVAYEIEQAFAESFTALGFDK